MRISPSATRRRGLALRGGGGGGQAAKAAGRRWGGGRKAVARVAVWSQEPPSIWQSGCGEGDGADGSDTSASGVAAKSTVACDIAAVKGKVGVLQAGRGKTMCRASDVWVKSAAATANRSLVAGPDSPTARRLPLGGTTQRRRFCPSPVLTSRGGHSSPAGKTPTVSAPPPASPWPAARPNDSFAPKLLMPHHLHHLSFPTYLQPAAGSYANPSRRRCAPSRLAMGPPVRP